MQNKFPSIEQIEYEEIYGKKRPQSKPHQIKTSHNLSQHTQPHPTHKWSALNIPHNPVIRPSSTLYEIERMAGMHEIEGYVNERNRMIRVQYERGGVNFCDCGGLVSFGEFVRVKGFLERWGVINWGEEVLCDVVDVQQEIERIGKDYEDGGKERDGKGNGNDCEGNGNDGKESTVNDGKEFTVNDGKEFTVNDGKGNGNDRTVTNHTNTNPTNNNANSTDINNAKTTDAKTIKCINTFFKENNFKEKKVPLTNTCGCTTNNASYNLKDSIITCNTCLDKGRYPPTISYSDFHSLQHILPYLSVSDEQLLSTIHKYGDDWQSVAQHLKITKEECVLRFLKKELVGVRDVDGDVLMCSGNRIMSVVSFLCSCVDARVAAVFARRIICDYEGCDGDGEVEKGYDGEGSGKEDFNEDLKEDFNEDDKEDLNEDGEDDDKEDDKESLKEDLKEDPNESPKEKNPKESTITKETTVNKEQHSIAHDNYESTIPNQNIKHSILIKNALKAAQHKAKELLTIEQNKMVRLVQVILEAQIKKMELKEEAFNDLKGNFKNERIELMKIREGYKSEIEEIKKEM